MSSTLFLARNGKKSKEPFDTSSPLFRSLPLNAKYVVDVKDNLSSFACAHSDNVARHGDLVTIVNGLKVGKLDRNDYHVTDMELTMPCLRETVLNVHNSGGLLPVEATASGDLFVSVQIQFVDIVKPMFIVVEMAPVHAHSDKSHSNIAKDFCNIGYYTHVTDRVPSAFCGGMTDQNRWSLFGHAFPGPSFGMLAYCNKTYVVGAGALDDMDDAPSKLWQAGELQFRERGEDDYPWGDEYSSSPYISSQFVLRSVLAGYVGGIKKKEYTFYDLELGSWPVITRQGIQLIDRCANDRIGSDEFIGGMYIVHHSSMGETARAKSFFSTQIKHLPFC